MPDDKKIKYTSLAVDPEAVATLNAAADELEKSFGFRPTLSQTLRHLLRKMAT